MEIAGTEGIPLTGAGWMKPVVVTAIYDELGMAQEWFGVGNREDMTMPVRQLCESAQRVGLLRKSKGRLLLTPAARKVGADDDALWVHLTARALPTRAGFERDASVLWLVALSAIGDVRSASTNELADWLTALGWRTPDGAVVPPMYLPQTTQAISALVSRVAGRTGRWDVDPVAAQAFARAALMGEDD